MLVGLLARRRARVRRKSGLSLKLVAYIAVALTTCIVIIFAAYQVMSMNDTGTSKDSTRIRLVTSMGDITIELYDDMPITSENFRNLTKHGIYDGTAFHRVVADFVIQGGDASSKGIDVPTIPDELPNKHSNLKGSVAMAKTDEPNSATSQFYINLEDNTHLDDNYSVFGNVVLGLSVVDAIGNTKSGEVALIKAEVVD